MQNLFRRPSGIYVLRIVIPSPLRNVYRKREVIASTGTRELSLAKIVAGSQAAQWRQRFFEATRLLNAGMHTQMRYDEILKITQGHPVLLGGGFLTLSQAEAASGVSGLNLLRAAADCKLSLFYRAGRVHGYLVPLDALELDDPELGRKGGVIIPPTNKMPNDAVRHIREGMLKVASADVGALTALLLATSDSTELHGFEVDDKKNFVFIPDTTILLSRENVEVAALEVESLRKSLALNITPDQVHSAKEIERLSISGSLATTSRKSGESLSVALEAYIRDKLSRTVGKNGELKRIKNGCSLLIELGGDIAVAKVDTDHLRNFRDKLLSQVPANENKIRLIHKTTSVSESITAVEGKDWPIMSASERNKRMTWIFAWFAWLKTGDEWISKDPTVPLRGESVVTKAEKRSMKSGKRDDESRETFDEDDLQKIFGSAWFKTGRGTLTQENTYRTFCPYYYWLPLFGLTIGGGRINELCQLHLTDFGQTENGVWYVNINESATDQTLKNVHSNRKVPLHPILIELGFDKWHTALLNAGYTRLFPELKRNTEKGYGKAATKWFTGYKKKLGIPCDGIKVFHSMRHNYINAMPLDTPDRISNQMTGHQRGTNVRSNRYMKDVSPDVAAKYVNAMELPIPKIAPFDIEVGLKAITHALQRKNGGRGATEDGGQH